MLVDTNDDDWVDRELVTIRRMGRLAMERELYNTYRAVAQPLPPLNDATTDELVALYQSLSGEHPNWDEYRAAMVADRRLVVRLAPMSAYGMLPGAR